MEWVWEGSVWCELGLEGGRISSVEKSVSERGEKGVKTVKGNVNES